MDFLDVMYEFILCEGRESSMNRVIFDDWIQDCMRNSFLIFISCMLRWIVMERMLE